MQHLTGGKVREGKMSYTRAATAVGTVPSTCKSIHRLVFIDINGRVTPCVRNSHVLSRNHPLYFETPINVTPFQVGHRT